MPRCVLHLCPPRCLKLGLRMPRMGWGCKDLIRKQFRNFQKNKVSLERRFTRSSDHATEVHARASNLPLERTVKVLDGWNLRSTDARRPLELDTLDSARAPNPPLERTVKQCRDTGCSDSTLERKCKIWEFQIEPPSQNPGSKASKPILLGWISRKHL